MQRRRVVGITLIVLFLTFAAGVASWRWRGTMTTAGPVLSHSAAGREAVLEQSLRAIAEGERAAARDRWDPAYLVEQLGRNPDTLRGWVQEHTSWVPYRGVLRGPVGVLMDRQGNSLDRALLLATLLERAGHRVRLARGELSESQARALLRPLVRGRVALGRSASVPAVADWRNQLRLAVGGYQRDSARIARSIEARLDSAMGMLATLDARTEEQTARLRALLPPPRSSDSGAEPEDSAIAELRDHWWVQRDENGRWLDLDVMGVAAQGADELIPQATYAPAGLDSTLYQRVIVRLVTERVSGGTLLEQRSLEREIRPSTALDKPAVLIILPAGWQPGLTAAASDPSASFRKAALEEREWRAMLTVGGDATEAVITLGRGASTVTGNPFGGLGRGIAGAVDQDSDDLSAAWLEYELLVPGRPTRIIRRQLFDLVGPAARALRHPVRLELTEDKRLERSLALTRTTEILPLGAAVAPEFLLHLTANAALANRNFLRAAEPPAAQSLAEDMDRFAESVAAAPSHLYTLAAVRMSADPDAEVFLDQPNVLSRHAFLALRRGGIVRVEATDIVANDVAPAPGVSEPAETRRRQGVRDTNAEALLYAAQPVVGSVADAFARHARWLTITAPDDPLLRNLPADIRQRMVDDLAQGYLLVAPASLAGATRPEVVGWWRTDPHTGQTLGISGTGWGSTLAERALKYSVILGNVVVEAWMFQFLRCISGIDEPEGATGPVARAESPLDWLVTPAWAQEGQSRTSVCVWEAWRAALEAGLFYKASVVWGLLVKQVKLWRMLRAATPAEAMTPGGAAASGSTSPGGQPPSKAPAECPPGGGAPGGAVEQPPPMTAKAASEEPGVNAPGGRPDETPGAPPAEPVARGEPAEPAARGPAEEPTPFDEAWGDLSPIQPGQYEAQANGWVAREPGAAQLLQQEEAFAREAETVGKRAEQELAALEATPPPPGNDDAHFKRMGYLRSLIQRARNAPLAVARAKAALDRIRALVEQLRRLETLNQALIQARAEAREASESFARLVRNNQADFQGNPYVQWRRVMERYERALKEYAAAYQELGKIPGPPRTPGVTLPLPSDPVRAGGPQPQCGSASPPAGPPPPGSPPPGSPPSTPAADAQRRLAEAQRELEAARDEVYRLDHDIQHPDGTNDLGEFTAAERELLAREKQLAAEGKSLGPHDDAYRALLRRKIDAVAKVMRLLDEIDRIRAAVQELQRAASAPAAPLGAAGAPPQVPVLVGLGGMSAP